MKDTLKAMAPLWYLSMACAVMLVAMPWIIGGFFMYADWVASVLR